MRPCVRAQIVYARWLSSVHDLQLNLRCREAVGTVGALHGGAHLSTPLPLPPNCRAARPTVLPRPVGPTIITRSCLSVRPTPAFSVWPWSPRLSRCQPDGHAASRPAIRVFADGACTANINFNCAAVRCSCLSRPSIGSTSGLFSIIGPAGRAAGSPLAAQVICVASLLIEAVSDVAKAARYI